MLKQPRAVWAVAFACVIAFMGIGLVDPILKPIADELGASPSQVSLLFTSYMAVMGLAMLVTGVVSSRIGAKRTLLVGLVLIIVFSALAGASDTVGAIVYRCDTPGVVTITLDTGGAPSFASRRMLEGTEALSYNLYRDAGRTVICGDGTGGSSVYSQAAPGNQDVTVSIFGRILPGQDVAVGSYANSVTATIEF